MLRCKEVARIIASDELDGASWTRKLAVQLHLLMCKHCREYVHQLAELGRAIKGESEDDTDRNLAVYENVAKTINHLLKEDDGSKSS